MVLQVIGMHWVPVRTQLLILRVIGWVLVLVILVLVLILLHVIGFVLVLVILVLPQVNAGCVEQQAGSVEREQRGMAPERFSLIASLELKESKSKV